MIYMILLNI